MKKFINLIHDNAHLFTASLALGLAAVLFIGMISASGDSGRLLANEIIRLHILPASDSASDQELKLLVRDGVLELLSPDISAANTVAEVRQIITASLSAIEHTANYILAENYSSHTATVRLAPGIPFPTMSYGGFLLPQGSYEALQVIIGGGGGANWWCVVFPNLCLVDIAIYGDICHDSELEISPRWWLAERARGLRP